MTEKVKVPEEVWRATHGNGGSVDIVGAQMTVRAFLREMRAHGWRMVPVEATEEMTTAGKKEIVCHDVPDSHRCTYSTYHVMLAAAPELEP